MSIDNLFLNMTAAFFIVFFILQMYFENEVRKRQRLSEQHPEDSVDDHLSPRVSFWFGLLTTIFYFYLIVFAVYNAWVGRFSVWLSLAISIFALFQVRKPLGLVLQYRRITPEFQLRLPLQMPTPKTEVSPDDILFILNQPSVIEEIKNELKKTRRIGSKEQWRLGVITPDTDIFDLSLFRLSRSERLKRPLDSNTRMNYLNQIPVKRAAILHPSTYFNIKLNNLLVVHGKRDPMVRQYPGWSYRLYRSDLNSSYQNLRDIEIDTTIPSAKGRSRSITQFLQEDGFPLKNSYLDGDPLMTERGGTIVFDRNDVILIQCNHFVQRSIIDDQGNLIYLGHDEELSSTAIMEGVSVIPSISKRLYKCVEFNGYLPVVRFKSFPYASDFMLPILDTPMSDSGWADLFVDTRGEARLYIAMKKTLEEWKEMMEKLRQLFFEELVKSSNHLLVFTKDKTHLYEYFVRKQQILKDYFIVEKWSF